MRDQRPHQERRISKFLPLPLYIFEELYEDSVVALVKGTFTDVFGNPPLISKQMANLTLNPLSDGIIMGNSFTHTKKMGVGH